MIERLITKVVLAELICLGADCVPSWASEYARRALHATTLGILWIQSSWRLHWYRYVHPHLVVAS
jgi:hypothetical protein